MRLVFLFLAVAVSIVIPFLVFGEINIDQDWLANYGQWAWLAAILCLIADLFLALPASAIITALGILYGPLLGGLIGATGSFLAGLLAYGLARCFPESALKKVMGNEEKRARTLLDQWGIWGIACSRFLPVLPETLCLLAGLSRMHFTRFLAALGFGSLAIGFSYAALPMITDNKLVAMIVSLMMPVLLMVIFKAWIVQRVEDCGINTAIPDTQNNESQSSKNR